ncbi:MAG TPA: S-adenosylmethionine decarboxylase [Gemmatimonadales bacterium]|nr:S-adenosylmethionine decarboxylase [Gemmatimonadales bacterium]
MRLSALAFDQVTVELRDVPSDRLGDEMVLSALVVAAAGAVGMPPHASPIVKRATGTVAVGLLCREGHIVLHTSPQEGLCLVDIVARRPAQAARGVDVITRRLSPAVCRP